MRTSSTTSRLIRHGRKSHISSGAPKHAWTRTRFTSCAALAHARRPCSAPPWDLRTPLRRHNATATAHEHEPKATHHNVSGLIDIERIKTVQYYEETLPVPLSSDACNKLGLPASTIRALLSWKQIPNAVKENGAELVKQFEALCKDSKLGGLALLAEAAEVLSTHFSNCHGHVHVFGLTRLADPNSLLAKFILHINDASGRTPRSCVKMNLGYAPMGERPLRTRETPSTPVPYRFVASSIYFRPRPGLNDYYNTVNVVHSDILQEYDEIARQCSTVIDKLFKAITFDDIHNVSRLLAESLLRIVKSGSPYVDTVGARARLALKETSDVAVLEACALLDDDTNSSVEDNGRRTSQEPDAAQENASQSKRGDEGVSGRAASVSAPSEIEKPDGNSTVKLGTDAAFESKLLRSRTGLDKFMVMTLSRPLQELRTIAEQTKDVLEKRLNDTHDEGIVAFATAAVRATEQFSAEPGYHVAARLLHPGVLLEHGAGYVDDKGSWDFRIGPKGNFFIVIPDVRFLDMMINTASSQMHKTSIRVVLRGSVPRHPRSNENSTLEAFGHVVLESLLKRRERAAYEDAKAFAMEIGTSLLADKDKLAPFIVIDEVEVRAGLRSKSGQWSMEKAPCTIKQRNYMEGQVEQNWQQVAEGSPQEGINDARAGQDVLIALGSNMGDRLRNIEQACRLMEADSDMELGRTSLLYETEPMYMQDQEKFLNAVCQIRTELDPLDLLDRLQAIENKLGRVREIEKGPRTLDLDILTYGKVEMHHERLQLPHPGIRERAFVLRPAADINSSQRLLDGRPTTVQHALAKLGSGGDLPTTVPLTTDLSLYPKDRSRPTRLMSILNVTPDSFSDGGAHDAHDGNALRHTVEHHIRVGATLIDIGGQSSRPGAPDISAEEEIARVLPAIAAVKAAEGSERVAISIDTYRAAVAEAAIQAGAHIINDISAGKLDPDMLPTIARLGCTYIMMHMRGTPATMQNAENCNYPEGLLTTVKNELWASVVSAMEAGIRRWRIILDPGIGFSKTPEQNLELLRGLPVLRLGFPGVPWLIGSSRKSFIGKITGVEDPAKRQGGTAATVTAAIQQGADIVRVHDVEEMAAVVKMADAMYRR